MGFLSRWALPRQGDHPCYAWGDALLCHLVGAWQGRLLAVLVGGWGTLAATRVGGVSGRPLLLSPRPFSPFLSRSIFCVFLLNSSFFS